MYAVISSDGRYDRECLCRTFPVSEGQDFLKREKGNADEEIKKIPEMISKKMTYRKQVLKEE